ncbi:MAG: EamA family transporter [Thermomicrobiales bacterium]|nr:EamA family transporter [Thermomicrobiales bacterium]MCO5227916.1 EamA family transporter [Thermomicrobiales bacterium]
MSSSNRNQMLPWLAFAVIAIVWGTTYLGMKAAVETLPPFTLSGARFFTAAPVLLLLALPVIRRGDTGLTWQTFRNSALIGIVLQVGGLSLQAVALKHIDSGMASLLVCLNPIWMSVMMGVRTRTKPATYVVVSMLVALVGIAIMIGGPGGGAISAIGVSLMFVSSFFWCIGSVQSRFTTLPTSALVNSGIQLLVGGSVLMVIAWAVGEWDAFHLAEVSQRSWIGFVWLVIGGSLLAYNAYAYAINTLPIEIVSTYVYINPIVAIFLGAVIDNEQVGTNVIIGGGIILLAVVSIVSGPSLRRMIRGRRPG